MNKATDKKQEYHMYDNDLLFWEHEGSEYCLEVTQDDMPLNPRTDVEPLSIMFCHPMRNHSLGDKLSQRTAGEFWSWLVDTNVPHDVLAKRLRTSDNDMVANMREHYIRPEFPRMDEESDEDLVAYVLELIENNNQILSAVALCEDYVACLPLWIYEHSGITMSCGERTYPFNDKWDSYPGGWIVLTKEQVLKNMSVPVLDEHGNPKTITDKEAGTSRVQFEMTNEQNWYQTAISHMTEEVDTYDKYLQNDVYFYTLTCHKNSQDAFDDNCSDADMWEEQDSCSGFYGSDILKNGICENVGLGLNEALLAGRCTSGKKKSRTIVTHYYEKEKGKVQL